MINAKEQLLGSEARALDGAMQRFKGDALAEDTRARFDRLEQHGERLSGMAPICCSTAQRQVDQLGKLLESYSFHSVLNRGFALVRDQDGQPVLAAAGTRAGDTHQHRVRRRPRRRAGHRAPRPRRARRRSAPRRREGGSGNQGSLL